MGQPRCDAAAVRQRDHRPHPAHHQPGAAGRRHQRHTRPVGRRLGQPATEPVDTDGHLEHTERTVTAMARRPTLEQPPTRPTYLAPLGARYPDGRCRSSMDGTVWLYRTVPLAPVVDARDNDSQLAAMEPLFRAYQELGAMVGASSNRRFVARSSYRRTHALLVNIPRFFHLPWTHPIA